jgi:hypothetical protein
MKRTCASLSQEEHRTRWEKVRDCEGVGPSQSRRDGVCAPTRNAGVSQDCVLKIVWF